MVALRIPKFDWGIKVPRFTKLKDGDAFLRESKASGDVLDPNQWRVAFPHLAKQYDAIIALADGGPIDRADVERIARANPPRRGKGRGENRDALARSPTGGGSFLELWYSDSGADLEDPLYDPEDDHADFPENARTRDGDDNDYDDDSW